MVLTHFCYIYCRYLATGDSYTTIAASYQTSKSTLSHIIPETCEALYEALHEEVIPTPSTADWIKIAKGYERCWQFPNCVGSIDGKHIVLQAPPNSGSMFLVQHCSTDSGWCILAVYKHWCWCLRWPGRWQYFFQLYLRHCIGSKCIETPRCADVTQLRENLLRPYPGEIWTIVKGYLIIACHEQEELSRTPLEYSLRNGGYSDDQLTLLWRV